MNGKGILLVDDEAKAVKYFSKAFGNRFQVYAAGSADEALSVMEDKGDRIGVVLTDQRMPEVSGVELLKTVRDRHPHAVRVLTTAYSDLDILVEAINTGAVYSFVSKPWRLEELNRILNAAMEQHENQLQTANLLENKIRELKEEILEDHAYQVGLIAARLGHYVYNALSPVTFLVDKLLEESGGVNAPSSGFLRNLRAHLLEVSGTLRSLEQATSPLASIAFQPIHLETILDDAIESSATLRSEKRLRVEKTYSEKTPLIYGISSKIKQLFRFMLAEEVVSLPTESLVKIRSSSHTSVTGVDGVLIEFEDFEPLSKHLCTKSIFHPFNLRGPNPREFGVFLASSYFLAKHHGGYLQARTKADAGLIYEIFLPSHPPNTEIWNSRFGTTSHHQGGRNS